jgi:Secretion system C-terminal sorting domain
LLLSTFLIISLCSVAQQRAVTLDPKLGTLRMTDVANTAINENFIQPGQLVKLVIPVASVNQNEVMPKGSCKVKIGLGSKLTLDPTFDLAAMNVNSYFTWSVNNSGGQSQLTGELTTALPASFQQIEVAFKVVGNQIGHSTITANFLITNHNTATILSDNDGSNNAAFLKYAITNAAAPVPVTTMDDLVKLDCSLKVLFSTDRELDLKNYELELSKNGVDFVKVYQTNASNLASYNATITIPKELQSPVVYARVKSIAINGRIAYSNLKSVYGMCDGKWVVNMYPNPAKGNEEVTIRAIDGFFNGRYKLTFVDMSGKIVEVRQLEFNNVPSFKYRISNFANGKYTLKMVNVDATQTALLQFEKL